MENLKSTGQLAMTTKLLLFVLLLFTSCGKDVRLKNSQLESLSNITVAETVTVNKEGILFVTDSGDSLQFNGNKYPISKYSSHLAFTFINTKESGQYTVKFKGEIKKTEAVIELIEDQ